ncbi:MAG: heavy metal translocating P-type ATPase [Lachnospiraceae bacterium]|nr:heavy metal translocating P-type ATPase [Lachnospiraceae bacterium]
MTKKQKKVLKRIIISAVLVALLAVFEHIVLGKNGDTYRVRALGEFFGKYYFLLLFLYLVPYFIIGGDILKKALKGIRNKQVFDENFLMAIATVGALALGVVTKGEEGGYLEGVAVMLFYQIGELFQAVAVGKSRKNIVGLMDIRPDYANMEDSEGNLFKVSPDEVFVGDVIVVKPGEKIPLDGKVISGKGMIDTAALTGESVPREVFEGSDVISGCVNLSGLIKIKTTKPFGESTVSKILDLVENSSMKKSKSENFIAKFARYYTPVVCYAALALAVIPPIAILISKGGMPAGEWAVSVLSTWVIRALTFLVISCPCALVISIPLSFFGGIGAASSRGILVKGSNYLEALSETGIVVFDKTGTLTKGVFDVTSVHPYKGEGSYAASLKEGKLSAGAKDFTDNDLLKYAAAAESYSDHPIAESLKRAYREFLRENVDLNATDYIEAGKNVGDNEITDELSATDIEEISGHGLIAMVEGKKVAAGNIKLMEKLGIRAESDNLPTGTIVHVAVDGLYAGYIVISDVVKENSKTAIAQLKAAGIRKTVMLTGDLKAVAESVGSKLGLDEVRYELLPGDKVDEVEKLLDTKKKKEKLAFVGDGINDAPVLSRADIGIAMGAMGSDAAIEAADVVLMDDDPAKIALAMKISRKCLRIVYENIIFALAVKFVCLVLGALGIANMWIAIFADVGVMVIAVLNAVRCLRVRE